MRCTAGQEEKGAREGGEADEGEDSAIEREREEKQEGTSRARTGEIERAKVVRALTAHIAGWLARSLLTNELSTHGAGKRQLVTSWGERNMNVMRTLPRLLSDTGQKKTPEKKDGRRMSFQRPKGTIEYSVSNTQATLRSSCINAVVCF